MKPSTLIGGIAVVALALGSLTRAQAPATSPAAQLSNGHWWEAQPGWSDEVAGLKIQLTGGKYLTPRMGMGVEVRFWNKSGRQLAICADDPETSHWEVRDANDKPQMPEKPAPGAATPIPHWTNLAPQQSGTGLILGSSADNRNGTFSVAGISWKLKPGEYTLHGAISGLSKAAGKRGNLLEWAGKIDLPPLKLTVLEDLTPERLTAAAKKMTEQKWPVPLDKYAAMARLIQPGMTFTDLQLVLPPSPGTFTMVDWSGNIWISRYDIGDGLVVNAMGSGQKDVAGQTMMVLSTYPKVTKQEVPLNVPEIFNNP